MPSMKRADVDKFR